MNLAYQDDWLTIYGGDCRTVLAELPDESVHCVVTSPPYWGLRDYGTATWEGGEESCDHRPDLASRATRPSNGLTGGKATVDAGTVRAGDCGKCGAVRIDSQLGLEPTPEQYVENMVAVFREVRRVLRSDGTVWLNLGDSYAESGKGAWSDDGTREANRARVRRALRLKPKDLVGIPWLVAFALQADGWYLRSDIIWSKPNPMPESVTDRPTKSHEYVFLLAKSARYYFDADAVREGSTRGYEKPAGGSQRHATGNGHGGLDMFTSSPAGRNIRTVWTVATQPYPGAHFAVFPEKLIEPCILAGTSERGVCPECGAPWRRVTETTKARPQSELRGKYAEPSANVRIGGGSSTIGHSNWHDGRFDEEVRTLSWIPSCAHDAEPVGAVVLDPFGGSGTTARVANRLSRRAVLIDLNPDYLKQQMDRNRDLPLGLGA